MTTSLTPEFVYDAWSQAQGRRNDERYGMEQAKKAYESRLMGTRNEKDDAAGQVVVEVPRMPGIIQAYTGFLFPRSPRAVVSPDVEGDGDAEKAQLVVNRWFAKPTDMDTIHGKISSVIGQALLYKGAAIKLGLDLTKEKPQDRVWARVIPWWDLILDSDQQDLDDQRYIGHDYWEDMAVLERRVGKLPDDIQTVAFTPYFERDGVTQRSRTDSAEGSPELDKRYVRVLEWYNFIDDYETETGKLRGVYELYLVDQFAAENGKAEPFIRKAMPYSNPNGDPCVPILPLIFDSEKGYPLKGIALAERALDQVKELCLKRSAQANAVRRNARTMFLNKDAFQDFNELQLGEWVQGKDGAIIVGSLKQGMSFNQAFEVIKLGPMSGDDENYELAIERDLNQASQAPKFTRGEAMGGRTTKFEVQTLNQYMENRLGELARIKDVWIASIARSLLRVMAAACKVPALVFNASLELGAPDDQKKRYDKMKYRIGKNEVLVVEASDIDAEFDISIADAASTPMTRETRRQDLLMLSPKLLELWEMASQGNPMAKAQLNNVVDLFDLPADFSFASLVAAQEQQGQAVMLDPKLLQQALVNLPEEAVAAWLQHVLESQQAKQQQAAGGPPGGPPPGAMPPPGLPPPPGPPPVPEEEVL
ncbi:MAG: hypothetical protein ABIL09_08885 [Gemmatimonadota bacterium]